MAIRSAFVGRTPTGQVLPVSTDTSGAFQVNGQGLKATYRATQNTLAPIAGTSFSIQGSSSKVVRITKLSVTASAATGTSTVLLISRYSVLSGGSSIAIAGFPLDVNDPPPSAIVRIWSSVPTVTTLIGAISYQQYEIVTTSVSVLPQVVEWRFGDVSSKSFVLRGISDFMTLGFGAVGTTPTYTAWVEWTEE